MEKRTLRDVLDSMSDDDMIVLGAKSGFVYIAPKQEMLGWLATDVVDTQKANCNLEEAHRQKCRLKESPKIPFIDREVISVTWNDFHNGYIVLCKGTDIGRYFSRGQITGEEDDWKGKIQSYEGSLSLITAILAEYAHDITDFEVFKEVYCQDNLNASGKKMYQNLKTDSDIAIEFLNNPDLVSKWTDIAGDYIIRMAYKNVPNKIRDIERKVCRVEGWDKVLNAHYTEEEKDRIIDMIVDGIKPKKIIDAVGRGKFGTVTTNMISSCSTRYESAMKKERRKYMAETLGLHYTTPLREQMTYDNHKAHLYFREHGR